MAWSVSAIGKSSAVKAQLSKELDSITTHCSEPGKTVVVAAKAMIAAACDAQIPDTAVKVSAWGIQSIVGKLGAPDSISNELEIKVEVLRGFVE